MTSGVGVYHNKHFEPGKRHRSDADDCPDLVAQTIRQTLGSTVDFRDAERNVDHWAGKAHSTTSLPYTIHGTAKVIEVEVGKYLAEFKDPIKAILSTEVHTQHMIHVTRKYVVGGGAMVVPEHAPARTVAIKEDVSTVELTRYGSDIEMNLNQFLQPKAAAAELKMKTDAQKFQLEQELITIGYDMLLEEGIDLVTALGRSFPGGGPEDVRKKAAQRINLQSVFGAMSKHPYPIHSLLAAARNACHYTIATQKGSVMIVPQGVPDLLRYTRPESMVYNIAGPVLTSKTKGAAITMEMDGAYTDVSTDVKIMVHHGLPSLENGYAEPGNAQSQLVRKVAFGTVAQIGYHDADVDVFRVVDLEAGGWVTPNQLSQPIDITLKEDNKEDNYLDALRAIVLECSDDDKGVAEAFLTVVHQREFETPSEPDKLESYAVRVKVVANMASAILAVPGESTGSLLVGYPFTSVGTSLTEQVRIQMRVYMGAVMRRPENVVVMRDVAFQGLVSGHTTKDIKKIIVPTEFMQASATFSVRSFVKKCIDADSSAQHDYLYCLRTMMAAGMFQGDDADGLRPPMEFFTGTSAYKGDSKKDTTENNGHMGKLDHPDAYARLWGAYVYSTQPSPV